jgi:two-component system cell cycle sensor histidine kinase/response regulator CckA
MGMVSTDTRTDPRLRPSASPSRSSDDPRAQFDDKMEAVSRLAGGVAHQFNNLLTAILSTTDLALESPNLEAGLRQDLQDIREATLRAASITRQLLAFSGSQTLAISHANVNEVLSRLEPLLRHLLPPNVTLQIQASSIGIVETDSLRLEQVLITLVSNAVDASPKGGAITITAEDVESIPGTDSTTAREGPFTRITIADTGLGMAEHVRVRVFEPFYSTKESSGAGLGLGLASVYGTMQQLGGGVTVESALGVGTRVELYIPRVKTGVHPIVVDEPPADTAVPAEVVLVVEDEAIVRAPVCRTLRNLGYFVLEANNGEDALLVMQNYHAPIHLIITDVRMPEMNGPELVALLRDWYPRMKVLFISGYSNEYLEAQGGMVHGSAFLAKPFSMEELGTRVRQTLDTEWTAE